MSGKDAERDKNMSYITHHRVRLEHRHYITNATAMWFNFYDGKLKKYISYGDDFCLVVNCSRRSNDAFILPFKNFIDFFTPEFLDRKRRWHGYIRADDEVMRISPCQQTHERLVHEYHNAFHLLQGAPLPLPKESDASEFV
jgi:hypothetical protein